MISSLLTIGMPIDMPTLLHCKTATIHFPDGVEAVSGCISNATLVSKQPARKYNQNLMQIIKIVSEQAPTKG